MQWFWASLLGLSLACGVAFALVGFTVDDALISARYASHLAQGVGHRFNGSGPLTDGVTPLVWPYLLCCFGSDPLRLFAVARWVGMIGWLGTSCFLGMHLARVVGPRWSLGHLSWVVAFGTPAVGAWASAGMETSLALCLVTVAAVMGDRDKRKTASVLVGVSCLLRPELLPFALTLGLGSAWLDERFHQQRTVRSVRSLLIHGSLVMVPFLLVMLIRWKMFDAVAPLALRAKPSDITHGIRYALATWLIAGPPLSCMAPWAFRKLRGWPAWLLAGWLVHTVCCVLVGGDWMPLSRLFVPVLPALAIVFAHLASVAHVASTIARALVCMMGQAFVYATVGVGAHHVVRDRMVLIEQLRGQLRPDDVVACLDVGWVGVAHRGSVFDLAGVTDPQVAALPGGHTSKRVTAEMLDARGVTHLLVLLARGESGLDAWQSCGLGRSVEVRLCRSEAVRAKFHPTRLVRSTDTLQYLLLERGSSSGRGQR